MCDGLMLDRLLCSWLDDRLKDFLECWFFFAVNHEVKNLHFVLMRWTVGTLEIAVLWNILCQNYQKIHKSNWKSGIKKTAWP
jgi:hypothetical protein